MRIRQFQVDAFASRAFEGNPAAVVPLDAWPDDALLQAIAEENNLSETAFLVPTGQGFRLRWFTPAAEVDLCGHATLASAHVLFEHLGWQRDAIVFETRSGALTVRRDGPLLEMDFPAQPPMPRAVPATLAAALGEAPAEVLAAVDWVAVFDDEATVRALRPDFAALAALELRGVIVTAPGREHDFVSRFFAPKLAVPEDPVTGSAHCALAPYWARRLGRTTLRARQVSRRGGDLRCKIADDRVRIAGSAVTFLVGEIDVPG